MWNKDDEISALAAELEEVRKTKPEARAIIVENPSIFGHNRLSGRLLVDEFIINQPSPWELDITDSGEYDLLRRYQSDHVDITITGRLYEGAVHGDIQNNSG